ncbi:hypothetical protein BTO04_09725 [Polaribacter sp. SA4-10]|uniref:DUF4271 domain-containing protein n=1 Tax=Polaribacter sp. SA4-10 TaxID=754397 RepID=UPI000B3D4B94|nr:hypothetical protein BTO04_09725 [Polaribacter sp. SA4-10]
MQALEKIVIENNFITLLLVLLLAIVFLLKGIDSIKLKGYVSALFNKGFVEIETDENRMIFKGFYILIFTFSVTVLSLILYFFIRENVNNREEGFYSFFAIFSLVLIYFLVKWILEYLFSSLFLINKGVHFFLVSKTSYLYAITFLLFGGVILVEYSQLNASFLFYLTAILFFIRFVAHVVNNKKLIFSELFYFILYLCAFEIAPLFILFKLIF